MNFIKEFGTLGKGDAAIAGGKGASLGEMTQAGIPVPPGFVILSNAFERFLDETDLSVEIDAALHSVNQAEMHTVENASEKIQALILDARMPDDIMEEIQSEYAKLDATYVAVRSSATAEDSASAAWAGQLDSYLNTTANSLLTNVQKCWASLFTPRAIFYRFEKELHKQKISVAVVVQKMAASEVSGIAFSVHPVTEDRNQLIIEAGFGLGEAIVSGQVTPDSYVVEKEPRGIIDTNVSTQTRALYRVDAGGNEWRDIPEPRASSEVLTPEQILELSEIILTIERHYGFPCDIEWAFEAGKFYIVQSRPITTLTQKADVSAEGDSTAWALDYIKTHSFDIKEGRVSLLVCDIFYKVYAEKNCFGQGYSPIFVPYANQVLKQAILEERMNGLERNVWETFISDRRRFDMALQEANDIQAKIDAMALRPNALHALPHDTFEEYFSALVALLLAWWKYGSIGEEKGLVVDEKILPLLMKNRALSAENAREYVMTMTMPSEQSIFSKERAAFLELCIADSLDTVKIQQYADAYFYARSDFYSAKELTVASVTELIAAQREKTAVAKLREELSHLSGNHKKLLSEKEAWAKQMTVSDEEKPYLEYLSALQEWLDVRKLSMLKHFTYLFYFLSELSAREGVGYETLSLMTVSEMRQFIRAELVDLHEIQARESAYFMIYKEGGERIAFTGDEARKVTEALSLAGTSAETNLIRGTIASKGKGERVITAKVRLVVDPSKDEFNEGEILVTSMTRPEFVPIMKSAAAIVTDEGGIACHAAIVSRELGIPCIIGTKIASRVLKSGDLVEVDAENGVVRILKSAAALQFIAPELAEFEPEEYRFTGLWKCLPFAAAFWVDCYEPELLSKLGIDTITVGIVNLKGGHFFNKNSTIKAFDEQLGARIDAEDRAFFENMVRVADDVFEENVVIGKELRDAEPTVENFIKFVRAATRGNFVWLVGATYFVETAEKKLQDAIIKYSFPPEHAMDIVPPVLSPLYYRHKSLMELEPKIRGKSLAEIQENPELNRLFQDQVNAYPWIEMLNFLGDPLTPERLYDQILHMGDAPEKAAYKAEKPLSTELAFRAQCLHDCGYIKQAGAEYFSILTELVLPFLNKVANRLGISYRDLMCLVPGEIEQALLGDLTTTELKKRVETRERTDDWILISKDGGGMIVSEDPADIKQLVDQMVPRADTGTEKLRGQVGNPGTYTGRVKVIMNTDDFHKMESGDVLVSTMTTPDFVILMQKSGAIVTDIGGMLCHAAIVSREMNKPCVIGTKFATQVLHDGDLVEVDADNGVVHILQK
jgi:phosphoenolpyruvate synthase/pyruvate phosphate dikinase